MDTIKNRIDQLTATAVAIIETIARLTVERYQLRAALEAAAVGFTTIDLMLAGCSYVSGNDAGLMACEARRATRLALGSGK